MDGERLAFAGLVEQRAWLANGSVTVRELVSTYLRRIERIDSRLNSFISVHAHDALEQAERAQHQLDKGDQRPLLGIPFAVKDEHHLAGHVTSFGTGACSTVASDDDGLVRTLRSAGAIPIGKTAMPELGMHPVSESATWGTARNPWDLSRTPGGSSGGSAAAVAAGLASFATAGDGGGSIRIPASCCNLFGLKAQAGRLPVPTRVTATGDLSVPGVLARRVADTALLYDLLATDAAPAPGRAPPWRTTLSAAAESADPGRLHIGLAFSLGIPARVGAEVHDVIVAFRRRLESLGHRVSDVKVAPGRWDIPFVMLGMRLLVEESHLLDHPERLERRTRSALRTGSLINTRMQDWALRKQHLTATRVNHLFEHLDLVLAPTLARPPVEAGRWFDRGSLRTSIGVTRWCPFTSLANFIGNPAASVPAGFSDSGLPIGADLLARTGDETTLIALGAQLEHALHWWDTRPGL